MTAVDAYEPAPLLSFPETRAATIPCERVRDEAPAPELLESYCALPPKYQRRLREQAQEFRLLSRRQ